MPGDAIWGLGLVGLGAWGLAACMGGLGPGGRGLGGKQIDMPPVQQVGATFKKAPKASKKRVETGRASVS